MILFRALRFDGVGTADARLRDLTIPLDDPTTGLPSDSVIWIRNGGGKTTLLSLLFSLFLPAQRHFVWHRTEGRTLGDYVLTGDTALVAAEVLTSTGPVVVGAYYEWPDRRRPTEWRTKGSELNRVWFAFRPDADVLELVSIPRLDEHGTLLSLRDAIATLERVSRRHPSLRLSLSRTQTEWATALVGHGIDTGLLDAQLRVAGQEGGFEQLFAVSSTAEFVNRIIELLLDEPAAMSLSQRIENYAESLRRRPVLELERRFATELEDQLRDTAACATRSATATLGAATRLDDADRLAAELVEAAGVAEERKLDTAQRAETLSAQITDIYQRRTAEQQHQAAFHRREAQLHVERAQVAVTRLSGVLAEADATNAAWDAVEQVIAVAVAQAQVDELTRAQDELEAGAAPQRLRLARAAHRYRSLLDTLVAHHRARLKELEVTRRGADDAVRARSAELPQLRAQVHAHDKDVAEAQAAIDQRILAIDEARTEGDLRPDESPEAGVARLETACEHTEHLRDEAAAAEHAARERAGAATDEADAATTELHDLEGQLGDARRERAELEGLHDRIADDVTVRDLAGTDHVDVWAARSALEGRVATSIDEQESAAGAVADELQGLERSLDALSDSGLLPPPPDVADAMRILERADIRAVAGYEYLARSVPRTQWDTALREHPALCAGLVVDPDDLQAAHDELHAFQPAAVVVLGAKSTLDEPPIAGTSRPFVFGPLASAYDPDAAPALRATLEARRVEAQERREGCREALEMWRDLSARLTALYDRLPSREVYRGFAEAVHAAELRCERAQLHVAEIRTRRRDADDAAQQAAAQAREHQQQLMTLTMSRDRLRRLVPLVAALPGLVEQRDAARAALELLAIELARVEAALEEAHDLSRRARGEITQHEQALERHQADRGEVGDALGDLALPVDDIAGADLAELRRNWRQAVDELDRAVTDRELDARCQAAKSRLAGEQARLAPLDTVVVGAAQRLVDEDPDARVPLRRRARIEAAKARCNELTGEHFAATAELEKWQSELVARGDDAVGTLEGVDDIVDPDVARELAAAARRASEALREEAGIGEQERDRLENEVGVLVADCERLMSAAQSLEASGADSARVVTTTAWKGDAADAASTARHSIQSFREAEQQAAAARDALRDAVQSARDTAAHERYTGLDRALTRPVAEYSLDVLAVPEEADRLAREWRVRARELTDALELVEQHRRVCVEDLAGETARLLDRLNRASTVSRLPDGLGAWAGLPFLSIRFTHPRDDVDAFHTRVGDAVDTRVARSGQIAGEELLKLAVAAAVPAGFRVTILKPSPDLHPDRVTVTELGQWSGGERLTAAVLLFCVIAAIRADRTGARESAPGVLIIDNPLGKASYRPFVELQRRIAELMGVQLLYTTGIKDMPAVGAFPNLVRCRNSSAGRWRYLHLDSRAALAAPSSEADQRAPEREVSAVRVHREGPAPSLATDDEPEPTDRAPLMVAGNELARTDE